MQNEKSKKNVISQWSLVISIKKGKSLELKLLGIQMTNDK
jgi:hypothetical protein